MFAKNLLSIPDFEEVTLRCHPSVTEMRLQASVISQLPPHEPPPRLWLLPALQSLQANVNKVPSPIMGYPLVSRHTEAEGRGHILISLWSQFHQNYHGVQLAGTCIWGEDPNGSALGDSAD